MKQNPGSAEPKGEIEAFEGRESAELREFDECENRTFESNIDRTEYKVHQRYMTGTGLQPAG